MPLNLAPLTETYRALQRHNRAHEFPQFFQEALRGGDVRPDEFSVRELFEEYVDQGAAVLRHWQRGGEISEAAVNTGLFKNITGQLVINSVMEGAKNVNFIGDQLVETVPTTMLDGEKVPGMTRIGNQVGEVGEGQEYETVGLGEDWIQTPELKKHGVKIQLTKEMIIADRTGLLLGRAKEVGYWTRYEKEIRILDMVLGNVPTPYIRKGRAGVDVYGANSGNHDWKNLVASNPFTDWRSVETVEQTFEEIVDPDTGAPAMLSGHQVIVPGALKHRARITFGAPNTELVDNQANATTVRTVATNPLDSGYTSLSSPLVKQRTSSDSSWYTGDFKRCFKYREVFPLTVTQAPTGHPDDFDRDITAQWKASEMGVVSCENPRYVVKCTG